MKKQPEEKKKSNKKRQSNVQMILQVFRLLFEEEPKVMILTCLYWVSAAVISGLEIWAARYLYDALYSMIENKIYSSVMLPIGLCILIYLSGAISGCLSDRFIELKLPNRITCILSKRFFRQASEIEYKYFDNDDYYNGLTRAKKIAQGDRAYQYVIRVFRILGFSLEMISQVVAVAIINPFLLMLAFLSVLPTACIRAVRGRYYFVLQHYRTPKENNRDYLWKLLCSKNGNRELQLYGAAPYIIEKWQGIAEELRKEENRFMKKSALSQLGTDGIKVVGYFCGLLFSVFLLLNHQIELGIFITCINAFVNIQQRFEQVLKFSAMVPGDTGFLEDYFKFLSCSIPERKEAVKEPIQEISLEHVSYQYSGQPKKALDDVSFSLKKGEILAVVGENGSGKSTLAKLMLGLYAPQEGIYRMNKESFSRWDGDDFFRRTAVIYQDYMRYELAFRENIGFGDLECLYRDDVLLNAAQQIQIDDMIRSAPHGLNTLVGRQFGDMELSGGQWQKLAIARGFLKSAGEFIVVDEPTASIDPVAESDTFRAIAEFMDNKTGVLITHRLGIAQIADRILVLEKGKLVEIGTHEELMEQQGVYYRLFMLQAKWYGEQKT